MVKDGINEEPASWLLVWSKGIMVKYLQSHLRFFYADEFFI